MYYLSRSTGRSVPVPADAPYVASVNERKEWDYHQHKHQEALKKVSGLVDRSKPKCIDPPVQSIQARTRRFQEDWKKAEIGRENRKLVDKLHTIAKTHGTCGPPPQAVGGMPSAAVALLGTTGRTIRPSAAAAGMPPTGERSRSLNDCYRRKVQRGIDQENAGMVRRILSVKGTFDPKKDERDFQRHKRAVNLLQRMPDRKRNPRSLPPLRPQRSNSNPATVRNLEALIFPGDLQRSESGPGALEWRSPDERGDAFPRSSSQGHAMTAPLSSEDMDTASASSAAPAPAASEAAPAPAAGLGSPLSPGATGPDNEQRQAMQRQATGSAFPHQSDSETERRQWIPGQEAPQEDDPSPKKDATTAGQKVGISLLTGMSSQSELQYTDDWEEDSFTGTSSASGQPSRGPSTSNMGTPAGKGGTPAGKTGGGLGSSAGGGLGGTSGAAGKTGGLGGSSTGGGLGGTSGGLGSTTRGGLGGGAGGLGGTSASAGLGSSTGGGLGGAGGSGGASAAGGLGSTGFGNTNEGNNTGGAAAGLGGVDGGSSSGLGTNDTSGGPQRESTPPFTVDLGAGSSQAGGNPGRRPRRPR